MNKHTRLSLFSALFAILTAALFAACGSVPGTGSASASTSTGGVGKPTASTGNGIVKATASSTSLQTTGAAARSVPLKVTGVNMALSLPTFRNIVCGTDTKETYVATFHFPAKNVGGTVEFEYTMDNKQALMPAHLVVRPGQTSVIYTFSWIVLIGIQSPGTPQPGPGGVIVTTPNAYTSALVTPLGPCIPAPAAPFKVNSVSLVAGPEVTGHRCGTSFTENYTATFNIEADGPGGTIVFQYTTNNGRSSSSNVSLHVAAGQTTATYVFKWSGALPESHTAPGIGIVMVSAPSQMISLNATPPGGCNNM